MKKLNILFVLGLIISLTSCDKDENNPSNNGDPGDVTLGYNRIQNQEFSLWVGGKEMPTDNLNIEDYMKGDSWEFFNPDDLSVGTVEFEGDSIIVNASFLDSTEKYAYEFSNDSLFVNLPFVGFTFVASGDKNQLQMNQGYLYYSRTNGSFWQFWWRYDPERFTFESTENRHGFESLQEMSETDTVLIFNQDLIFN